MDGELVRGPYPPDTVDPDEDDGTMPYNVAELTEAVVGRKIVKAEQTTFKREDFEGMWSSHGLVLTLDDGRRVALADTDDCCAFTNLEEFLLHPEMVDHVITGVATTGGFTTWHIFADYGDIMQLKVGWSAGNPFYYGYGFDIGVSNTIDGEVVQHQLPEGRPQLG